jgi:hypothetical protein
LQRLEGRGQALPGKGGFDDLLLPAGDECIRSVLKLAATAAAGVAARGFDAVGGGGDDPDIDQTVAFQPALDNLARKDAGHEDRAAFGIGGDTMPKVTETVDGNLHSAASA